MHGFVWPDIIAGHGSATAKNREAVLNSQMDELCLEVRGCVLAAMDKALVPVLKHQLLLDSILAGLSDPDVLCNGCEEAGGPVVKQLEDGAAASLDWKVEGNAGATKGGRQPDHDCEGVCGEHRSLAGKVVGMALSCMVPVVLLQIPGAADPTEHHAWRDNLQMLN